MFQYEQLSLRSASRHLLVDYPYFPTNLCADVHEQRGVNRGMCASKMASKAEVCSVRGALFF